MKLQVLMTIVTGCDIQVISFVSLIKKSPFQALSFVSIKNISF